MTVSPGCQNQLGLRTEKWISAGYHTPVGPPFGTFAMLDVERVDCMLPIQRRSTPVVAISGPIHTRMLGCSDLARRAMPDQSTDCGALSPSKRISSTGPYPVRSSVSRFRKYVS